MKVVVSGFGPFGTHERNPADALARAISAQRAHGCDFVACAPLPVTYSQAAAIVLRAAQRERADAIVALGLAAATPHVRIERFAHNLCTAFEADAKLRMRAGCRIMPGAPARLRAALDIQPISRALSFAGIVHTLSDDAGGYVCNDLYFRLLAARAPALFVHVPSDVSSKLARPLASGIALSVRALVRSRR